MTKPCICFLVRIVLVYLVVILQANCVSAQDESIKTKRNIKVAYERYPLLGAGPNNGNWISHSYHLEKSRPINNYLDIGGYLGACYITAYTVGTTSWKLRNVPTLFYGIRSNIQLVPIVLGIDNSKMDFYVSTKVGGFLPFTPEGKYPVMEHSWDYGLYFGVSYWVKKWGVFFELGKGNYSNGRLGITFKFNKGDLKRWSEKKMAEKKDQ